MTQDSLAERLSRISTIWSLVTRAQGGPAAAETQAQAALLERYQRAVYRYLFGALRDPDAADEVFQDFALRFVRGDFRRADPACGRFRDYVKTSLINLVINYRKARQAQGPDLGAGKSAVVSQVPDPGDPDKEFLESWRKELLDRAWEALAAAQVPGGPPYLAVLRCHTEEPELTSTDIAARLTEQLQPATPFTDAGVRKLLQRARGQFTDLLVDEVARSLKTPTRAQLEEELGELGFLAYCRKALNRRRPRR